MDRFSILIIHSFFLVFFGATSVTQKILIVASAENHTPLAFASIVNHTKRLLLFANERGTVEATFKNGDSITISHVGYHHLNFIYNEQNPSTYFLNAKRGLLPAVEMQSCKKPTYFEHSNVNADSAERKFGGLSWGPQSMNAKVAILLNPAFRDSYLKSVSFWLMKQVGASKISIQAPVKLSFYEVDDSSSLPGELISDRQIIHFPKKEGKQTIGLDTIPVKISSNGIYVGIEYIIDKKYEWPMRFVDKEQGIDSVMMWYGARFDGIYSRDFRLAFYNYLNDRWYFPGNNASDRSNKLQGTIKFLAGISYCKTADSP